MKTIALALCGLVLLAIGCTTDPKSGAGFTLPEGDAARGQETFARLQCTACHTVSGVEFDRPDSVEEPLVALGGDTTYVRTYGDLVTSIINPSHRFAAGYSAAETQDDGKSKMRVYNDELTVTELADLVTFLQQHYELRAYQPSPYVPYH